MGAGRRGWRVLDNWMPAGDRAGRGSEERWRRGLDKIGQKAFFVHTCICTCLRFGSVVIHHLGWRALGAGSQSSQTESAHPKHFETRRSKSRRYIPVFDVGTCCSPPGQALIFPALVKILDLARHAFQTRIRRSPSSDLRCSSSDHPGPSMQPCDAPMSHRITNVHERISKILPCHHAMT